MSVAESNSLVYSAELIPEKYHYGILEIFIQLGLNWKHTCPPYIYLLFREVVDLCL